MFIGMGIFPIMGEKSIPFLPSIVISLLGIVPIAWVAALTYRGPKAGRNLPESDLPLYDAQLDHPA
jgi:hypothetical protein